MALLSSLWPPMSRTIRAVAVLVGIVAALGVVDAAGGGTQLLGLQTELVDGLTLPPLVSGALLLGVAGVAGTMAVRDWTGAVPRWAWALLALVFAELAVDELLTLHERVGEATRMEWMLLYAPLLGFAGLLWLDVARSMRRLPELVPWVAGATAWGLALALDVYAFGVDGAQRPGVGAAAAVEELLEMAGAFLLLWALVALHHRVRTAWRPDREEFNFSLAEMQAPWEPVRARGSMQRS